MSITVACVEWGNYQGRGQLYVDKLRSMVARNLAIPHEFVCLRPNIAKGWWNKIELFKPGLFTGRVLYLDLDSVVTGDLEPLVNSKGILGLQDWGWKTPTYGSGVMVWDAGEHSEIWRLFSQDVVEKYRGDQDYMTALGGWEKLPKGLCMSYRYHSIKAPPVGCSVVCMHGIPKPHEILTGWVPKIWEGVPSAAETNF